MKRIKLLVRKNLKMSPGKIAAQCVHAALGLNKLLTEDPAKMLGEYLPCVLNGMESVVVLEVSDKKFGEAQDTYCDGAMYHGDEPICIVKDAGYTEIPAGSETVLAFLEDDPRSKDLVD